jgi:hypothetical protein
MLYVRLYIRPKGISFIYKLNSILQIKKKCIRQKEKPDRNALTVSGKQSKRNCIETYLG